MANANEKLQSLQTTNQHLVEEYKNELIATMLKFFKRMEKLVNKEISSFYDEDRPLQKDKTVLMRKIKEIQTTELNKIKDRTFDDIEKFLGVEASLYKKQLEDVFEEVSEFIDIKSVDDASLKKKFSKTKVSMDKEGAVTIATLWTTFFNSVNTKIKQSVENAYLLEKSTRDFNSDINNVYKINENQLGAVIAVLIQQAYGVAMDAMNNVNMSFIRGYVYNAILDNRTSPICIEYNGGTWFYGLEEQSSLPYAVVPPQHYRCRSFTSPIIKSYQELGINAADLTPSQKELLSGEIPTMSYYEWFDMQPASIQKDVLGPVRYNAYQKGDVSITRFYNNGRKLTLNQLRSKGIHISEEYLRYVK
jgi:hypothetical protein